MAVLAPGLASAVASRPRTKSADRVSSRTSERPADPTTRRGRLALLLLGALGLALAVLWLRRSVASVAPSEPAAQTQAPLAETGARIRVAEVESGRRPTGADRDEDGQHAGMLADPVAIPREPIDVLVLDAITHEPAAGAEVRWANDAELGLPAHPAEFGVWYDFGRIDRRVEPVLSPKVGRLATADEHGIARIDTRIFPGRVSAILGERSGSVDVGERTTSPIWVYLTEQRVIPIQVVDGAGVPVPGVPVSLREAPVIDESSELWLGVTDESGLLRAELAKPRKPDSAGWTVYACLEIPLDRPVSARVDLRTPPTEPLKLVLPPCGSVVVGVREEGGRTAHRYTVTLRGAPSREIIAPDSDAHRFETDIVHDGAAHFPFVGLGLDVYPAASRTNDYVQMRRRGPRAAGEVVRVDLELAGNEPEVTGRFLTDAGEPLRERLVQIVFHSEQGARFLYPIVTDPDGRFRFFASVPERPGLTGSLLAMPIGIGPGEGGAVQTVIDAEKLDVAHDLGDLFVVPPRVIGAGLVVDDVGEPVPWPQVAVFAPSTGSENGWYPNDRLRSTPHADGTFEIRASTEFARVRVLARAPFRAESDPVEFEPGARDVRLVTARGCQIAGRVLVDEGVYENAIQVHAIGPGPRVEAKPYRQSRVQRGAFEIGPIAPGRYDLEFRRGTKAELIHRIDGIDVPPAGKAVDARLDAIDLRGKMAVPHRR